MKNYLKLTMPILLASVTHIHGGALAPQHKDTTSLHTNSTSQTSSSSAVFLSHPAYTFDVFFTALILQPTGSDLHYAAEADPLPVDSPHWYIHDIHTDYHFGFDVGLGGIFHSANADLAIDWEHFHSEDSSHKQVPSSHMIGPFFEIGPDASSYKKARGHATFHFDQVNLDYGQFVNFGDRLQTHLFAGASFARIKQTIHSRYSDFANDIVRTINVPSLFIGAGPQLGLDFTYRIVKGFQFVGQTAASLFVGTMRNHTHFKAFSPALAPLGTPSPNKQSTRMHERTQVVPGFEANLGFAYAFSFCKHYMIKLEAGYEAQIYLNAIQSADIGSEVVTPPEIPDTVGVFARTFQRTLSNFALAGPYAKIELGF